MGLDMYLYRYPRYKHYRPEDIDAVDSFIEWENNPDASKYTLKEWCGVDEKSLPPKKDVDYLRQFMTTKYWAWDTRHEYPNKMIHKQVAYWRKANAIHKWFVDNIQSGEDDCCYHREVTEQDLEKLIGICEEILDSVVLEDGKVLNGYVYRNGKEEPSYQDGKQIVNKEVCERLLPSESGFFFGGTDYDQWYMDGVKYTYEVLSRILKETDFEKQMLFYVSSW